MIKAIYIEQYGAYWRLTVDEYRQLLGQVIREEGYTLSDGFGEGLGKPLASRPHHVYKPRDFASDSLDPTKPLFHPLDWGRDSGEYFLEQLEKELGASRGDAAGQLAEPGRHA